MSFSVGRSVAAILAAAIAGAVPCSTAVACADFAMAPSTRWSLTKENGVSWLVTPCGERFFSIGVNVLDGGNSEHAKVGEAYSGYDWQAFAPTLTDWAEATRRRLFSWGFNSAGGWGLSPQILKLPTFINLELGRLAKFHWFDPFAPETETRMMALARDLVAPFRGAPYRIGYFSDNEAGWWTGALFVWYSNKPANSPTKQRWVETLRRHYGGEWSLFAADFLPPAGVTSWEALLAATETTRMRPDGEGIRAVREWTAVVAEHYYALTEKAIRSADPDGLYFGDRLPIYYDPAAVRAMAQHVDAIAVNYNVDSSDGWIADYFFDGLRKLSGGKPAIVTEWFFAARENRSGNHNNGHLMTVATQRERAVGAAAATASFAAIPEIVGLHWFQYYDHPKGGRTDGEDYNFGLVDVHDRPYGDLVAALAAANRRVPEIHAKAAVGAPLKDPFVLPHAAISTHDHSLSDWPKPSSLLPRLKPSPGAVEFGEAYLSWGEQGIALATIGQDYFDVDLLAYDQVFPLSDAYRVELGVDAGAGPRRLTLFFIPPRTKRHTYSNTYPMTVQLCTGAAGIAIAEGCTAVDGAEAVYFGSDQPRITAEMVVPWSALGIALPPAPGTRLRAEIAITSWDGERWMSLSGRAPSEAMKDSASWRTMQLGDGLEMIHSLPPRRAPAPG